MEKIITACWHSKGCVVFATGGWRAQLLGKRLDDSELKGHTRKSLTKLYPQLKWVCLEGVTVTIH